MTINELNELYSLMTPEDRITKLFQNYSNQDILVTSSFGSSSSILLHLINKVKPGQPIYFLDTTFHFDETLAFRDLLTQRFDLNVVNLRSKPNKNRFTHTNKTWKYNPDLCCYINKVEPLEEIKGSFQFWVSGLMAFQSKNRKEMNIFEEKDGLIKFHPLIDMTSSDVALYQLIHELPTHPLTRRGYNSIGCFNCTKKGSGRNGRWAHTTKTECGLHS